MEVLSAAAADAEDPLDDLEVTNGMNQQFFKIAVTRLSLFRASRRPRAILSALADATGIPVMRLLAAERRMRALGSLAPLKELLQDEELSERHGLRWQVGLNQKRKGEKTPHELVASVVRLRIRTALGKVDIMARVEVARTILPLRRRRQTARILMMYRISQGGEAKVYHQTLALTGESVAGVPVKDKPRRWFGGVVPRTQHA